MDGGDVHGNTRTSTNSPSSPGQANLYTYKPSVPLFSLCWPAETEFAGDKTAASSGDTIKDLQMCPVPPFGCHLHCCHHQWSVFNEGGKVAFSPKQSLVGSIPVYRGCLSKCQIFPPCSMKFGWVILLLVSSLPSMLQFCMSYFYSVLNFAFSLP